MARLAMQQIAINNGRPDYLTSLYIDGISDCIADGLAEIDLMLRYICPSAGNVSIGFESLVPDTVEKVFVSNACANT